MIDEKKIEEAANEYANDNWLSDDCCLAYEDGFKAGIDWFKKNIWHDAKEEPRTNELMVTQYIKDHKVKYMMFTYNSLSNCTWKEHIVIYHITKWCYIKDLI